MTSEAESQVFQPDEDESFWQLVRANGDAEVRFRILEIKCFATGTSSLISRRVSCTGGPRLLQETGDLPAQQIGGPRLALYGNAVKVQSVGRGLAAMRTSTRGASCPG